jgi:hypothetical protein
MHKYQKRLDLLLDLSSRFKPILSSSSTLGLGFVYFFFYFAFTGSYFPSRRCV